MLDDRNVLITGGTGSLGKKLVRHILDHSRPRRLVIYSRDELKQFEMAQKFNPKDHPCLRYVLGDVRDAARLVDVFGGIDYVIHAAALKQVPAAEHNPSEFVKTNVMGAMNIIEAARINRVRKVIALSTDKACNPTNLYGATKLCSDKLFCAANYSSIGDSVTRYSVVRYGNVLGSRGSVVPFFVERAATGVLPITDPRMTRFWITISQAVEFVLRCLECSEGGEIFVPHIPSTRLPDLATAIAPQARQETVGIRPGEKLHETMISRDDARNTIDMGFCYAIIDNPDRRQQAIDAGGKAMPLDFCYSSDNNPRWFTIEQLRELLPQIAEDFTIESRRWSDKGVPV